MILMGGPHRTGHILTNRPTAAGAPPSPGTATNLLVDSKLTNTGSDWEVRYPGEGSITSADSLITGHKKVTFDAGGTSDRASWQQVINVVAGEVYTFSVYVVSVASAPDPSRVIINHVPYSRATVTGGPDARPDMGSVSGGNRYSYTMTIASTGALTLILGLDGEGEIELERPMLDPSSSLRDYVATDPSDPVSPSEPGSPEELAAYPFMGEWELCPFAYDLIYANKVDGMAGPAFVMPFTGTITEVQIQMSANKAGETTKSAIGGNTNHAFPATWDCTLGVWNVDANWRPTGAALFSTSFTRRSQDGSPNVDSRCLFRAQGSAAVSEGDRIGIFIRNDYPSTSATTRRGNAFSFNTPGSYGWVRPGDAQHMGVFWADNARFMNGNAVDGSNMQPSSYVSLPGFGMKVDIGSGIIRNLGCLDMDSSPGEHRKLITGTGRVRQRWSKTYARKVSAIGHGFTRVAGTTSTGAITIRLSGSDISNTDIVIAGSDLDEFQWVSGTATRNRIKVIELPSSVTLSPGTTYTLEMWISSGSLQIQASFLRLYKMGHASYTRNTNVSSTAMTSTDRVKLWQTDGGSEYSTNGGSTWTGVSYGGDSDAAISGLCLRLDKNVAPTVGELP